MLIHKLFKVPSRNMCILFIYTNPNPETGKYQLVIATNRDEYFIRPAATAHRWSEDELIIGGKDLEAGREGGTWFGVSFLRNSHFKFRAAALLNITGETRHPGAAGRGRIVTDYLRGDLKAEDYIKKFLHPNAKTFNAFSFVAVELCYDIPKIFHYTNVTDKVSTYHSKDPTFIGFGNSLPDEPLTKVLEGERKFRSIVLDEFDNSNQHQQQDKLRALLRWDVRHLPDPVLARRAPDTFEHLSSVFVNVQMAGYGTRTHTIITVDADGNVNFLEDTMNCPPPSPPTEPEWHSTLFQARL